MHRQKKNTKSCQLIEKRKMLVQNSAKYVLTLYEWVAIVSGTTPALCDHLSCFKQKTSVEMHLINSKKVHVPRRIKWEGCCCFWIVNNSYKHKQESSRFVQCCAPWKYTTCVYCLLCFPVLWHSFNLKLLDYHVSLDLVGVFFCFVVFSSLKKNTENSI